MSNRMNTQGESRHLTPFEVLDLQAAGFKHDAKMLGAIGAISSLSYTLASGIGSSESGAVYNLSSIPIWGLILGLLVCAGSMALSVHLCKTADRKIAEKKKSFEKIYEISQLQNKTKASQRMETK